MAKAFDGNVPTEFFYGALEMQQRKDIFVGFHEVDLDFAPGVVGGLANILAQKEVLPEKLNGSALEQIKNSLKVLNDYDCVVATTSGIAFALAAWKSLCFSCPPIVAIHCGLLNNPYSFLKKKLTAYLMRQMSTVLFGEGELSVLQKIAPNAFITVKQFGVDINFWQPGNSQTTEGPYILAVGNDGRRDFETLIRAVDGLDIPCRILTKRKLPKLLPSNVEHIHGGWHSGGVSDQELRTLYQQASCVVVPLWESEQPSGQSVTLQAMACGRPVILSRTKGLWSKEMMKDYVNVLLVEPGDAELLKNALLQVLQSKDLADRLGEAARDTVTVSADIHSFAEGILETCHTAMKGKCLPRSSHVS